MMALILVLGLAPGAQATRPATRVAAAVATPTQSYVIKVYSDLFSRTPDPAGLLTWTTALLGGAPLNVVANSLTASNENRGNLINGSYRQYLGRSADSAGLRSWLDAMRRGWTIQQMEAGFVASPEYFARAGSTTRGWVARLYTDVLGRTASTAEINYWTGALSRGKTRGQVATGFLLSTEHLDSVIDGYYRQLLSRGSDPTGRSTWVRAIQNGTRAEAVIGSIVSSGEYIREFGANFPPAPLRTAVSVSDAGWLRTASNTGLAAAGVNASMLTPYTGSLTITGRQYRKVFDLGANQLVLGAGAVLDQCIVRGNRNGSFGQVRVTGAGVQILNSDIIGSASTAGESFGIYADSLNGLQISSLRMTGFTIFMWLDSGSSATTPTSIIDGFYGYNMVGGAAHHDGLTRRLGQAPIILRNSRIAMTTEMVTGAVFLQPTWGPIGHVTVENSYLEGNGYPATIETSSAITFNNNRFRPTSAGYGPVSRGGAVSSFTWANNYYWAGDPANGYRGQLIQTP